MTHTTQRAGEAHGPRVSQEERERILDQVIAHLEGLGDPPTFAPAPTRVGVITGREAITATPRRDYFDVGARIFMSLCVSFLVTVIGLLTYAVATAALGASSGEALAAAVMVMGAGLSGLVYYLLGAEPFF